MKRLLNAAAALLCALGITASAQMLTVSGSHIVDSTGAAASNATIYFAPVSNNLAPLSYRIGALGQALSKPVQAAVSSGSFTIALPDTSKTVPLNVCFNVTVVDNVTGANFLGAGYTCVQPSSIAAWCTSTTCNFDNFQPSAAALVVQTTGPQGPAGATGAQGLQGLQGVPGTPGLQGTPGAQGLQGIQGIQGNPGTNGLSGAFNTFGGDLSSAINGSTTVFTLPGVPSSGHTVVLPLVNYNGAIQMPGRDYTISGNQLTLNFTPSGGNLYVSGIYI